MSLGLDRFPYRLLVVAARVEQCESTMGCTKESVVTIVTVNRMLDNDITFTSKTTSIFDSIVPPSNPVQRPACRSTGCVVWPWGSVPKPEKQRVGSRKVRIVRLSRERVPPCTYNTLFTFVIASGRSRLDRQLLWC